MTGRERQFAALRHETPDRMPVDAICIENQREITEHLGIEEGAVLDRLGIDGRIVAPPYRGQVSEPRNGLAFTEWGTPNTGDYGTARWKPLATASSIEEIERYDWPDVNLYDYQAAAEVARSLADRYAVRGPYWVPLFCRACDLFGMEEALVRIIRDPALFEAALEGVFVRVAALCEHLLEACGDAMPILCVGDDFATQRGLMISPESWRRFLKPRLATLFEIGKRRGRFVWFHSCGDVTSVLPDLIDLGVDVWETVQLHTLPFSPAELKRQFGSRLAFFGGVNTQRLPFARPEQVRDEVRRCIEALGKGGGYICGPDHHVKPDVSPENTLALFDTATSFRRSGYTELVP